MMNQESKDLIFAIFCVVSGIIIGFLGCYGLNNLKNNTTISSGYIEINQKFYKLIPVEIKTTVAEKEFNKCLILFK